MTLEQIEAVAAEARTLSAEGGEAALAAKGLSDGTYGAYGLSKALLNCYTANAPPLFYVLCREIGPVFSSGVMVAISLPIPMPMLPRRFEEIHQLAHHFLILH